MWIDNMFSSPTLSRYNKQQSTIDMMTTKHIIDEKSKTIEQLKNIIDELNLRHERKERELLKRIGMLYSDLQQNKKKMAHLIYRHQQQKKTNNESKLSQDISIQTDEKNLITICPNCSTEIIQTSQCNDINIVQCLSQLKLHEQNQEQQPKYYTLQSEEDVEYIAATPQPTFNQSLSSPTLSSTDRSSTRSSCSHHHCSTSSTKHNESSSSAYNTAESLPSSTYSDEMESLERVLNAACTMYTTHDNLEHTIKLQEELFRQRLRLRGITVNDNLNESSSSEHLYDNIDGETSDIEKQTTVYRNRLISSHRKKTKHNLTLSTDDDEQQEKVKTIKQNKVRFIDQHHSVNKRKTVKTTSKTNLIKSPNNKRYHSNTPTNKKLSLPLSSNMLTVTIT
ncbi:unnamed protein product [Adineta steineri]|uniref:Uncharacterized protein n=2 Tax=Adineta steineri TaxID=433720 RepID=A0A813PSD4_9BILA|nr:unnamed protein product [Adineta steineri]CAF0755159.1 unnamed protein product [Adineta steineri]